MCLLNDFQQLADKFILGIWPFYALAVGAVFVLRRTRPELPRPYRTWGYPVVPILFLIASVGMIANALWTDPVNTGVTFGIILVGFPSTSRGEPGLRKSLATDEHGGNGSLHGRSGSSRNLPVHELTVQRHTCWFGSGTLVVCC